MPKKKTEKKAASKKAPAKKEKTQAKAKTTSKKADSKESKGRLVVSQHEKDEIAAVIDAFWLFIDLLKKLLQLRLMLQLQARSYNKIF